MRIRTDTVFEFLREESLLTVLRLYEFVETDIERGGDSTRSRESCVGAALDARNVGLAEAGALGELGLGEVADFAPHLDRVLAGKETVHEVVGQEHTGVRECLAGGGPDAAVGLHCSNERLLEGFEVALVMAPSADRAGVDWLTDLIVTRRVHDALGFVKAQASRIPLESDEVDNLVAPGLDVGDEIFVLQIHDWNIQVLFPMLHKSIVLRVIGAKAVEVEIVEVAASKILE